MRWRNKLQPWYFNVGIFTFFGVISRLYYTLLMNKAQTMTQDNHENGLIVTKSITKTKSSPQVEVIGL